MGVSVSMFSLLFYLFIGYHNYKKLNIDFAATMLGMKNVVHLTENNLESKKSGIL